ncbi:hypothetical protein HYD74_03820 [Mycoplasmopsis bovis]|nr:hypothetical protein HYD74_03820 [Mycoplasmopsis bovis]
MKKSKFLLLGSVGFIGFNSLCSSKCGETKEEKKTRSRNKNPRWRFKNPGWKLKAPGWKIKAPGEK